MLYKLKQNKIWNWIYKIKKKIWVHTKACNKVFTKKLCKNVDSGKAAGGARNLNIWVEIKLPS